MGPYFRYPHTIDELVSEQRWFLVEVKMMAFWTVTCTFMLIVLALYDAMTRDKQRAEQRDQLEKQELQESLLPSDDEEERASMMDLIKSLWAWMIERLGRQPDDDTQQMRYKTEN